MVERAVAPAVLHELEVHIDSCEDCRAIVTALAVGSQPTLSHPPPGSAWVGVDHPQLLETEMVADRYKLVSVLGRGGMGTVYLARDTALGRDVALKLHNTGAGDARLYREAVAMAKLSHPNVVNVFDVGTVGDRTYVALEYVRGETLRGWMKTTTRSWRAVMAVLVEAGTGLAAAHAVGLVHRDFKPDNVLVGADGRARVSDFGLAQVGAVKGNAAQRVAPGDIAFAEGTPLTETGAVLGTPAYMAPEQAAGEGVDARGDQFAFCLVAWECLLGVRPFAGTTLGAIQAAIAARELQRPTNSVVPEQVVRVLERGLAVVPADRHADMAALLAALRRAAAPHRVRRLVALAAGAMILIGGGIAIASTVRTHRHHAACAAEGAEVRALVGDTARARIREAFTRTKSPLAATAFEHTVAALERASTALGERAVGVCLDGDASPLAAARRTCVAARTSQLAQLVETLGAADAPLVQRATDAAWSFYDAHPCNDAVARTTRPVAADTAREIGRIKAITGAGQYKDAVAASTTLLGKVAGSDAELDVRLVLANAQLHLAPKAATEELHHVIALAEAQSRDLEAAIALDQLAHIAGVDLHDYAAAHRFIDLARAKLVRLGSDNLAIHGKVLTTEGQILEDENRMGEAETDLREAISVFEGVFGADHPNVGLIYGSLTQILRYQSKDKDAAITAEKSLHILEGALGAEHPNTAGARMTYAQSLMDAHDLARAREELLKADAVFARVFGAVHPVRAAALANLGGVELALENYEAARGAFTRAREIIEKAEGMGARGVSGARLDTARALAGLGRWDEAEVEVKLAIGVLEALGADGKPWLPSALLSLAELHLDRKRAAAAIAPAERALAMLEARSDDDAPSHLADARYILARALWDVAGDRRRAHSLAEQARAHPSDESRAEIEAWLAAHPAP